MSYHGRRLAAALTVSISIAAAIPAAALELTTEDNAPFNYQDGGRVAGMSTDILREMGKRASVPMNFHILPWARAYQSALTTPDTCVYSTVRLPEREAQFKWIGPLSINKWALFAKSDFNKPLVGVEEAKSYRIGGVIMDAKAMYLKSLGFQNIDFVSDDNLNLTKLLAGRIDLWVTGLYKGKEIAAKAGNTRIRPLLTVREVEYFLACHPQTPDTTVAALAQALQALQKEGYVKTITDRYAERMQ